MNDLNIFDVVESYVDVAEDTLLCNKAKRNATEFTRLVTACEDIAKFMGENYTKNTSVDVDIETFGITITVESESFLFGSGENPILRAIALSDNSYVVGKDNGDVELVMTFEGIWERL